MFCGKPQDFRSGLKVCTATCRDTVLSTICNELLWDLAHARPEPLNNILSNLFYRAPWIHEPLAPSIAAWMEQNEIQNHDAL